MRRSVVLIPVLLAATVQAAHSQNSYRTILEAQLDAVQDRMSTEGYRPDSKDMTVGLLDAGASVGLEIDLLGGVEYMIMGVCDADCDDLDLTLSDTDGTEVSSDALDDAYPVLIFTAPAGGPHILWVNMYDCSVSPCSFGYKVFRK